MIELKSVDFSYGESKILDNFNLTVNDGECVCLSGPSGCGKTTVLKLVMGLLKPDSGKISGVKRPSVVFQEDRLLSGFSLITNVLLPPLADGRKSVATELLKEANLGEAIYEKVRDLSGGMKRRAAIVRALCFEGDVLVLDEPFNGIDAENKRIMAEMIKREYLQKGKPVLMVSHIPSDAELLNARVVTFEQ
jgi:NitT/TauT family transport system ATP-binding protein